MARPLLWNQGVSQEPNVGLLVDRPLAGAAVYGMTYFATNTGQTFQCIETASNVFVWHEITSGATAPGTASLVYAPGKPAPLAPNEASTWAGLMVLFNATKGLVTIAIDDRLGPTVLPAGAYDFQSRATFTSLSWITLIGTPTIFDITDGAQLRNVREFTGQNFQVQGHGTVLHPLGYDPGLTGDAFFMVTHGTSLTNAGVVAMFETAAAPNGNTYSLMMIEGTLGGGLMVDIGVAALGGSSFGIQCYANSVINGNSLTGTGNITVAFDSSFTPTPQVGTSAAFNIWAPLISEKLHFSAAGSLLTAVPQGVPPCALLTDSANLGLGHLSNNTTAFTHFSIQFTGDAANVGGQTATATLLVDGVPVATTPARATTAGVKSADVIVIAPPAQGGVITVEITPSAPLTAKLTNIMAMAW